MIKEIVNATEVEVCYTVTDNHNGTCNVKMQYKVKGEVKCSTIIKVVRNESFISHLVYFTNDDVNVITLQKFIHECCFSDFEDDLKDILI